MIKKILLTLVFLLGTFLTAFAQGEPTATSFTLGTVSGVPKVITLVCTQVDGHVCTFTQVASPTHGAISSFSTSTGVLFYTATSGYTGADSFTYTVSANNTGGTPSTSAAATVTINVSNSKTLIIGGPLTNGSGPLQGSVTFTMPNTVSLSTGGLIPSGTSVSANLDVNGQYTVSLYPTALMSPNSYYQLYYQDSLGTSRQFLGLYSIPVATSINQSTLDANKQTNTNLNKIYNFTSESTSEAILSAALGAGAGNHNLLSALHSDTNPCTVATGSLIIGSGTPKWTCLPISTTPGQVLTVSGGTAIWATPAGGGSGGNPFSDAEPLVGNSVDNTKLAKFDASGISTGNTRVYTLPDRNAALGTTSGSLVSGNVSKFDSSGNIIDTGIAASSIPSLGVSQTWTGNNIFSSGTQFQASSSVIIPSIGVSNSSGFTIGNNTAATVGNQQYSPILSLGGQGWKTNLTASSQPVNFLLQLRPVQGAANPTGNLVFASSINGGSYLNNFIIDTSGNGIFSGGITGINSTINPSYLSSELTAGTWTNASSEPYETFTQSSGNITAAINNSNNAVVTQPIAVVSGVTYRVSFNLTMNILVPGSPSIPWTGVTPAVGSFTTADGPFGGGVDQIAQQAVIGSNTFTFTSARTATDNIGLWVNTGLLASFSVTNFSVKQVVSGSGVGIIANNLTINQTLFTQGLNANGPSIFKGPVSFPMQSATGNFIGANLAYVADTGNNLKTITLGDNIAVSSSAAVIIGADSVQAGNSTYDASAGGTAWQSFGGPATGVGYGMSVTGTNIGSFTTTGDTEAFAGGNHSVAMHPASFALGDGAKALGRNGSGTNGNESLFGIDAGFADGNVNFWYGGGSGGIDHDGVLLIYAYGQSCCTYTQHANSISTMNNQAIIGAVPNGSAFGLLHWWFGEGVTNTTAHAVDWNWTGGSGTDNAGASVTFAPGRSTGAATPSIFNFQTTTVGSTSSTVQTNTTRLSIDGSVHLKNGTVLKVDGSSSGTVTINTASAAGTWAMTLPTTAGSNTFVLQTDGFGVTSWVAQSGGTNLALSNLASVSINTSLLAQTGVDLGGTANPFRNLYLFGAGTYGTTYLKLTGTPTSTRTVTIPDTTDTLVGKATTDTLTNKTFDTAGTGNSFSINGVAATANTGTGAVARAASPTFTTPTLGVASATTINKVTFTAPATGSTLTVADGKTFIVNNTLTFTGTDSSSVAFGAGGTTAYTANNLSVFAATTSSQLAGVVSDGTGSGSLVFGTAPTITLANGTGLPISTGVSGLGTGVAAFLATPSSANLASTITDETGTGVAVFNTAPTFTTSISSPLYKAASDFITQPGANSTTALEYKTFNGAIALRGDTTTATSAGVATSADQIRFGVNTTAAPLSTMEIDSYENTELPHGLLIRQFGDPSTGQTVPTLRFLASPSPSGVLEAEPIGFGLMNIQAGGADLNASASPLPNYIIATGRMRFKTTENWNTTSHGTRFEMAVTPNGSSSLGLALLVDQDGTIFSGNETDSATSVTGKFSSTRGTGSNIAGADLNIIGGAGTGTGLGGTLHFQVASAGTTGSTLNSYADALTISSAKLATFAGHLVVEGVTSTGATGTANFVFSTSPTLITPVIGVATMTSLNKVVFTAPTTAATFAFPTDNATITFQGTDTYVGRATTDTLTNKTLTSPTITALGNLTSNGIVYTTGGTGTLNTSTNVSSDGNKITVTGNANANFSLFGQVATNLPGASNGSNNLVSSFIDTSTSGAKVSLSGIFEWQGTSNTTGNYNSASFSAGTSSASSGNLTAAGPAGGLIANNSSILHNGSGTVTYASVFNGRVRNQSTGTITAAATFQSQNPSIASGTTTTEFDDFLVQGGSVAGTITTRYGLKVNTLSSGTTHWGVWVQSDPTNLGGDLTLGTKIINYNGVATTGFGVPVIYGSGRSTAQTAAATSVATYTVGAADGSFEVSANVLVTASTTHSFTVTCVYTDEGNTSRTLTLSFSQLTGTILTAITNVQGAGAYEGVPLHIRCKSGTSITISSTGTFTSVTYNVEGIIKQMS